MTESTLSITYSDIVSEVVHYLGLGADSSDLTSAETARVDKIINGGLRQFYYSSMVNGHIHNWSFLEPRTQITIWNDVTGTVSGAPSYDGATYSTITATAASFYSTMEGRTFTFDTSGTEYTIASYVSSTQITVAGDASGETSGDTFTIETESIYRLPDNFLDIRGPLTFTDSTYHRPLRRTNEAWIRYQHQTESGSTAVGRPEFYAIYPASLPTGTSDGQRHEMIVYGEPDDVYTLNTRMLIAPNKIDSTNEYPTGGTAFGEVIMASVLAWAELHDNDDAGGAMNQTYQQLLAAAIARDSYQNAPDVLGSTNRMHPDNDDFIDHEYWMHLRSLGSVTLL